MNNKVITIVKANGTRENFNPMKLENSLLRSGANSSTVDEIINHVEGEIKDGMSTSEIYKHAFFLLGKSSKPVAARYSLRRAIMDLGPSGFPFEDYIAEIFKSKGYQTETDKMVLGTCVPHEIDVIAYNENKLIMAEAKFHNELGIKSDLKIALYVKARFDDLKEIKYFYGKERFLDEGWLITNTKFSSTAIEYGTCKGLVMIGWNYPHKANLQDMIEDGDLHPITCLSTLNKSQKEEFLKQGVVLCKTLTEHNELFSNIGLTEEKIKPILEEINSL